MEVSEGTPNLGVTSYWTDADGNVVFGPNTPKEKMKTPGSISKTQKQKGERTEIKILVTSFTDICSAAESATRALQMQQPDKDKLHVQNNVETIPADFAGEPKSASIQRADENQRNSGQALTSDKSESQKQPKITSETGTLPETDDIATEV